jgi:DNA-binding NarL/FixJ family response regulator
MRVVVAEDQLLTRRGIVHVLRDAGVDVTGEAEDVDGLVSLVRHEAPDVAIIDVRLPPTHTDEGLRAAAQIRAETPGCAILILSQHVELDFVRPLLEERAQKIGYLLKDRLLDTASFIDAISRVHHGECVIDPTIIQQLLVRQRNSSPIDTFTDREREVLALIAEGHANSTIGQRLYISERTVEVHTKQIFNKLGLLDSHLGNRRVLAVLAYLDEVPRRRGPEAR